MSIALLLFLLFFHPIASFVSWNIIKEQIFPFTTYYYFGWFLFIYEILIPFILLFLSIKLFLFMHRNGEFKNELSKNKYNLIFFTNVVIILFSIYSVLGIIYTFSSGNGAYFFESRVYSIQPITEEQQSRDEKLLNDLILGGSECGNKCSDDCKKELKGMCPEVDTSEKCISEWAGKVTACEFECFDKNCADK